MTRLRDENKRLIDRINRGENENENENENETEDRNEEMNEDNNKYEDDSKNESENAKEKKSEHKNDYEDDHENDYDDDYDNEYEGICVSVVRSFGPNRTTTNRIVTDANNRNDNSNVAEEKVSLYVAVNQGPGLYLCTFNIDDPVSVVALSSSYRQIYTDGYTASETLNDVVGACMERAGLTHVTHSVLAGLDSITTVTFLENYKIAVDSWKDVQQVFLDICYNFRTTRGVNEGVSDATLLKQVLMRYCTYVPREE
jgi:hypothetical protein